MAHTSTPWRLDRLTIHGNDYGLNGIVPCDADEMLCIEGSGGARSYTQHIVEPRFHTASDEDNYALIVRAVNAHEMMLAALKAVLTVWHDATATRQDDETAEQLARAAIAQATAP